MKRKRYHPQCFGNNRCVKQSISLFEKFTTKRVVLFANGSVITVIIYFIGSVYNKRRGGGQTIVVVDTSASMLVEKDGTTLFEKHKEAIRKLVNKRSGQPITIISTGKEPITVIREEKNAEEMISAINQLKVSYEHEFMERAIEFAQSIAADSEVDIHIFTDSLDQQTFPEASDIWHGR